MTFRAVLLGAVAGVGLISCPAAWAQQAGSAAATMADLLPSLLETDQKVHAARLDVTSAEEKAKEALGDWYPELNVTGWKGYQGFDKETEKNNTHLSAGQVSLSVTQLLYDFGKTEGKIQVARLKRGQAEAALAIAQQQLVLDAVKAYINVMRTAEAVRYSRSSEDNIRKTTGLEEARVQRGGGYSTDVLQAKSALAGAQARRVRAEGALLVVRNRYQNVFHDADPRLEAMRWPILPTDMMPAKVEDAVKTAMERSLVLKNEQLKEAIALANVDISRATGFTPRVELVGSQDYKDDTDGVAGNRQESTVKVQVKMPFNLGMTAVNSLNAAKTDVQAATARAKATRDKVEEDVRNAWQILLTARENAAYLRNQANISGEFLDLAKVERELGKRSLLDILNSEITYINAVADAVAAESEVLIQSFEMLNAMGVLEPDMVTRTATAKAAASPVKPVDAAKTAALSRIGKAGH